MKEIKVPELAESIVEGTIAKWLVKEGDSVEKGDAVIELETDKVNIEVHSDFSGVITEIKSAEGDDVQVGDTVALLDETGEARVDVIEEVKQEDKSSEEATSVTEEEAETPSSDEGNRVIASPAARKKAREMNIDLADIRPTDPLGRVRVSDVEAGNVHEQKEDQVKEASKPSEEDERVERIKMSRRRMTIAKRLVEAQQTAAMLTTFNEVDMSEVMKLRSERKDSFLEKNDVKLGFMSFFTKAVIAALKEFPLLNAEIQGDEIVVKNYYDIGIAVSTDEGLVVPVVRDADQLSFAQIEKNIASLGAKARDNELTLDDLQGGSFTITNGGVFGSMLSTPILNTPQVGILGMHNIVKRAVVMPDDSIEVRPMMYLALSYDHRIVDGKEAVQCLVRIKELLEDPYDLLFQ